MSEYLLAVLAHSEATTNVIQAERAVRAAQASYDKSQQRLTRHQAAGSRAVRNKYSREAMAQLDALDEAREILEDAREALAAAAARETALGAQLAQPSGPEAVLAGYSLGTGRESDWATSSSMAAA